RFSPPDRPRPLAEKAAAEHAPRLIYRQIRPLQRAEQEIGPAGAVPQPAQHHGGDDGEVSARGALAMTPERNEQIFPQKARQGHMPALPQLADVRRLVW